MSYFEVSSEFGEDDVEVRATYKVSRDGSSIFFQHFDTGEDELRRAGDKDAILRQLDELAWDRLPDFHSQLRAEHSVNRQRGW